jgi:hypothetical protein
LVKKVHPFSGRFLRQPAGGLIALGDSMKPSGQEIILGALCATAFWSIVTLFTSISDSTIRDLAGPVATVLAAAAAAYVAFTLGRSQIAVAKLQAGIAKRAWQTSNEKIVLDLFEKRLAIYEEIRATITPINSSGNTTDEIFL